MSKRGPSQETRKSIIDAALGEFGERGYKGATTIGISKAAGVSEKTLFDLFGNKKALYLETLGSEQEKFFALIIPSLPIGAGAPVVLRSLARRFIVYLNENRGFASLLREGISHPYDAQVRKYTRDFILNFKNFVQKILEEGCKSGLVKKEIDKSQIAWSFTIGLLASLFPEQDEISAQRDEIALMFIESLIDYAETKTGSKD